MQLTSGSEMQWSHSQKRLCSVPGDRQTDRPSDAPDVPPGGGYRRETARHRRSRCPEQPNEGLYDIWHLSTARSFELSALRRAVKATFDRRQTPVPIEIPFAITEGFLLDQAKIQQWLGFLRRLQLELNTAGLPGVGALIAEFVEPVFTHAEGDRTWDAGGPWR